MWDAHKDMALALLGGIISALVYTVTPLRAVLRKPRSRRVGFL
jgi:hypothetical protein